MVRICLGWTHRPARALRTAARPLRPPIPISQFMIFRPRPLLLLPPPRFPRYPPLPSRLRHQPLFPLRHRRLFPPPTPAPSPQVSPHLPPQLCQRMPMSRRPSSRSTLAFCCRGFQTLLLLSVASGTQCCPKPSHSK